MAGFILRGLFAALGLWAATEMFDGIVIDTPLTLIFAGLLLGVVNAIVRPIAVVLSLPALLLTVGLFLLVINAAMLGLVALLLPGFHIHGFWTAVGGSIVVSLVSWIASWFIGSRGRVEVIRAKRD
ncbi:MAG: phage holin family protein [Pseudomonadota bacterium]